MPVKVEMSNEKLAYFTLLLYGVMKVGKTVAAGTFSEKCPAKLPAKELTQLADMLFIQLDPSGVESLKHLNLAAPVIDLSGLAASALQKGFEEALDEAKKRAAAGTTKCVVVDSFTLLLEGLYTHYRSKVNSESKELQMQVWGRLQMEIAPLLAKLRSLPCSYIVISHAKADVDIVTFSKNDSVNEGIRNQQTRREATNLPGGGQIRPAMSPKIWYMLGAAVSYIWPLFKRNKVGSKLAHHYVMPRGGNNFEGGGRCPWLENEEPAHLRTLYEKIREGAPK